MKIEIHHANDNRLPVNLYMKRIIFSIIFSCAAYQMFSSILNLFS